MKLKFLGTAGGRFATVKQRRKTGGILITTEETRIHLDPGPGALYHTHQLSDPEETEAVILTHGHLDHYTDVEPIIEMMTHGFKHPGALFANETALEGYGRMEKSVSEFHKDLCKDVKKLEEGTDHNFKDIKIQSQEVFHSDPKTQGLLLENEKKTIGFWTDSKYSDELTEFYEDADTLVINCVMPKGSSSSKHTRITDIPNIIERTEASTYIISHMGLSLLEDLEEQKNYIEEKVDVKVIFAEDGMEFPGNRSLGDF